VIVFLVWLWVSNISILLGADLKAELERGRQIEAGAGATSRFWNPATRRRERPPRPG
jgi:membrane protein